MPKRPFSLSLWLACIWYTMASILVLTSVWLTKPWPNGWWLAYAGATLVGSPVAFGLFWLDKRAAQQGKRRISEQRLHTIAALGGWPGAVLAQQWLRHKSQKGGFRLTLWLILLTHIGLALLGVWATLS